MMGNQGSLRMENPYTISWEPPHSFVAKINPGAPLDKPWSCLALRYVFCFAFNSASFSR